MAAPKGNKFALGLTTNGQPPKYKLPCDLEQKCFDYFTHCIDEKESPTVTGLALFLGYASRQSIYDNNKNIDFSYILKRAVMVIENHHEERMDGNNVAGSIFVLKNMGWKDKIEQDINLKADVLNYTTEEREQRIKALLKKDAE